jgi:enoyl-CoA hydratase/carnithine racemase
MAESVDPGNIVLLREQPTAGGMKVGMAMLNSPKSLNALSVDMIRRLDGALAQWAQDPQIACVVLTGAGDKGLCAGGDVRYLREAIRTYHGCAPNPQVQDFFTWEYRLDYHIHTYPKPLLVWGDGVVMGGGLGLLAGASHRVVTERSRLAMPEVTIGLYPDVGASWFLPRMPGRTGLFLALSGASLNAHDALTVGLADFFIPTASRDALFAQLSATAWSRIIPDNRVALSRLLRSFAARTQAQLPPANVGANSAAIRQVTDGDTLIEVAGLIGGYGGDDVWMRRAAETLRKGSPTSVALVWEIWHRAKHFSLEEAFRMELIVSVQCGAHPDFAEGVRALLIDKDNAPRWTPATLAEVSPAWLAEHFQAPWPQSADGFKPLSLS